MEEILHRLCYNIKDENPETCKQLAQKLLLEPMLKANLMDLQQPIKVLNYHMLSYVTLEFVDDIGSRSCKTFRRNVEISKLRKNFNVGFEALYIFLLVQISLRTNPLSALKNAKKLCHN